MKSIIETHNLSKIYNGKIKAVDDLNIEIGDGEIYGLLGPNGAGKQRQSICLQRGFPAQKELP